MLKQLPPNAVLDRKTDLASSRAETKPNQKLGWEINGSYFLKLFSKKEKEKYYLCLFISKKHKEHKRHKFHTEKSNFQITLK